MDKKCLKCGYTTNEDAVEKCPTCNEDLVEVNDDAKTEEPVNEAELQETAEQVDENDQNVENAENVDGAEVIENAEVTEGVEAVEGEIEAQEAPKAGKAVKIICVAMAILLVVAAAAYFWLGSRNPNKVFDVSSFEPSQLSGKYACEEIGMYYEFEVKEVTTDVTVPAPDDETADSAADSAASSSAEPEYIVEERTFDGSYVCAYSEEYIKKVLISEYIAKNNLSEEYTAFMEENEVVGDGLNEYIKTKGIKEEDIEAMEGAKELRAQADMYTTKGYWDYNDETKTIVIYSDNGSEMNELIVMEEGLVSKFGLMVGEAKKDSTFDSEFILVDEAYGVTQEMKTYKDGNFIMKITYEGEDNGENITGTYEVSDGIITMEVNGQKMSQRIVDGGIAAEVYTK